MGLTLSIQVNSNELSPERVRPLFGQALRPSMTFLHMSLIAGLAVVTVPILLHMFGQRQPQLIDFPALKFVRQTTREQSSSWQLRHILLLLLRILLLALLAMALARPRVHSAMVGSVLGISGVAIAAALASLIAAVAFVSRRPAVISWTAFAVAVALWLSAALWSYQSLTNGPIVPSSDQSAPVAAVIIVDNGPSMAYRSNNAQRLETARETAIWILDKLPLDSRVGVLAGVPVGSLSLDPATAKSQVKQIEQRGAHIDLAGRIRTAIDLVVATELQRKEVYVITDLASSSWSDSTDDLQKILKGYSEEVLVQIIDVGDMDTANWRLGDAKPDFQSIPEGGEVAFEVSVERPQSASNKSATVELIQEDIDPKLPVISNGKLKTAGTRIVDRQVVDLTADRIANVKLTAKELKAGSHNFTIRLDHPDPLQLDNERFVTVLANTQRPSLVVADDADIARYLQFTIISGAGESAQSATLCETVRYSQLGRVALERFSVVCLYDPTAVSAVQGQSLKEHVLGGGGLLIILGAGPVNAAALNESPLASLLPGKVANPKAATSSALFSFFQPVALSHPVFHLFGQNEVRWNPYPVFKHWNFESLSDSAQTLVDYSDGSGPAVTAQSVGRGQVITITTPIPDPAQSARPLWNELSVGEDVWPPYALLLGCVQTLSGADQTNANYAVGEQVSLTNDPLYWPSRYELFQPSGQSRGVEALEGRINLGQFEQPGIYRMRGQRTSPVSRSVSINAPAADTLLERLTPEQLNERLGADTYRLARNRDEIESSVGQARFGRELFPLLMVFVAGLFLAEQAMSNRFYKIKFSRKQSA